MIEDKNRIYDGFVSLEGGVDAGRVASLLDATQCASAENMTFRGGHIATRPGVRKLTESFTNAEHCYNLDGSDAGSTSVPTQEAITAYKGGIFQCANGFNPHGNEDCLMAMINGRLFKIIPRVTEAIVTEIVLKKRNRWDIPLSYMVQADKWLVAQDGNSKRDHF